MDEEDSDFYESDEDAISDNESDVFEAPPVQAAEATFHVLDPEKCHSLAQKQIQEVNEVLYCGERNADLLLRHFFWDRDRLTDAYMTDPEAVAAKVGIPTVDAEDGSILHGNDTSGTAMVLVGGEARPPNSLPPIVCTICYDRVDAYSALTCGHCFCNLCYKVYLEHKIADEGHMSYFARCPEPKCQMVVSPHLVRSLVPPGDTMRRFDNAASVARSFVDDQPTLKWCPAPDCGNAIKCNQNVANRGGRAIGVQCACGHRFCFGCGHDDHSPATCENLQAWLVKCRDDSETYNWLVANTKACPKCATSIEKNGGCNHMTCKDPSCKHEFCWVCMGPWKDHSGSYYTCNKYDPEKEKDSADNKKKDSSRAALERYLHYYTRFTNHHNSLKFEIEAKTKMEAKIKEMEALGDNTWMDCQYLNEANEALFQCRYALKFTYVFAFYLPKEDNFRLQFENQQTELERQTEELAELLEKNVDEIKREEVVHCYKMAEKRLSNLMELVQGQDMYTGNAASSHGAGSSSSEPMQI